MSFNAPASRAGARLAVVLGLFVFIQIAGAPYAQAQEFGRMDDVETNINAFYYLVEPGTATIQISVFGKVQNPGVYVLEDGVNLSLLLGLSGGPTSTNQPDVKQTTTVRMYRNSGSMRSLAYEASFDEVMDRAADSPTLSEGDIVIIDVEQKRKMNWRDIFTVIGPLLSTLLLIERLTAN
ncbi:MAG: hypothetical protein AAF564_23550 [Bacteroidota bacterium]